MEVQGFQKVRLGPVLLTLLLTATFWCTTADALAPLSTINANAGRVWREDMFDLDLGQTPNLCMPPGFPVHGWVYDPTWSLYSAPGGAGVGSAFASVGTTGTGPPVDNDEFDLLSLGDSLLMAFVDTSIQVFPPPPFFLPAFDSGIFSKITVADATGSALLLIRLSHALGVPTTGYALEIDPFAASGVELRIWELLSGAPGPPLFSGPIASVTGLPTSADNVYHARFEAINAGPVSLSGTVWPLGMAERDALAQGLTIAEVSTNHYPAGFAGVGLTTPSPPSGRFFFDDMVHYEFFSPITKTILGFQGGGHFFAQVGNGNPDCTEPPPFTGAGYSAQNMWCTIACLHMLMDYWDNRANNPAAPAGTALPQEQIAHVANVNDVGGLGGAAEFLVWTGFPGNWAGTFRDDARRALHFSSLSVSADGVTGPGYTGMRDTGPPSPTGPSGPLGFSARGGLDGGGCFVTMSLAAGTPPSSASKLRTLLGQGYPVILHLPAGMVWSPTNSEKYATSGIDAEPETVVGHSVLCIGYHVQDPADPLVNFFEFHDPWNGPNVWVDEATLFGADSGVTSPEPLLAPSAWYAAGGPFTWGAPWEVTGLPTGNQIGTIGVNPTATYSDPILAIMAPPEVGIFPVISPASTELSVSGGMTIGGGANPQNLPLINVSGDSDSPSWTVNVFGISPPQETMRCDGWGVVGVVAPATSSSYLAGYIDEIGGFNEESLTLMGTGVQEWDRY